MCIVVKPFDYDTFKKKKKNHFIVKLNMIISRFADDGKNGLSN